LDFYDQLSFFDTFDPGYFGHQYRKGIALDGLDRFHIIDYYLILCTPGLADELAFDVS